MSRHYDFKKEYANALKEITLLQNIKRFSLRKELFNKLFEDPEGFEGLHIFLHPMFNNDPSPKAGRRTCKIYNLNKAFEPQYIAERQEAAGIQEFEDFDIEAYEKEKEEKRQKKQQMYKDCLSYLLECAIKNGGNISLSAIANTLTDAGKESLLPNVNVFKEVYVEFSKAGEIDIAALKEEQKNTILCAKPDQFELNNTILELGLEIKKAEMSYIEGADKVVFENVEENGKMRNVRCADMLISVTGGKADGRRF